MRMPTKTSGYLLVAMGLLGYQESVRRHYDNRPRGGPPKPGYGKRRWAKRKYRRQRSGYRTWMKGQR